MGGATIFRGDMHDFFPLFAQAGVVAFQAMWLEGFDRTGDVTIYITRI